MRQQVYKNHEHTLASCPYKNHGFRANYTTCKHTQASCPYKSHEDRL